MHKVMIVEDEDILRMAYVDIFSAEQFDVSEAANGKLALEKIHLIKPHLIILDVMMPIMSGIEFLQHIDLPKNYPDMKVLVLSNLSDKKTIQEVINLGATKHHIKSNMSPRELVASVRDLLV